MCVKYLCNPRANQSIFGKPGAVHDKHMTRSSRLAVPLLSRYKDNVFEFRVKDHGVGMSASLETNIALLESVTRLRAIPE